MCLWLASVAVFGAGVAMFDDLVYGGPLTTGYQPGEITFDLGAVGPNLRLMPAAPAAGHADARAGTDRTRVDHRPAGECSTPAANRRLVAARCDLAVGAALAASWFAIWAFYSAYTWTTDPTNVAIQDVRFYLPAIGAIALLGAWLVTRLPAAVWRVALPRPS